MKKNNEYLWKNNKADNSFSYLSNSIKKILNLYNTKKLSHLDIGCGNGYLTKKISNYFERSVGIDISKSAISQAKKNYNGKIKFYRKKISNINKKFNFITIIEVIEHLYSPDDFLKKLSLVADNKTIILITTPYHSFIKNLMIILFGKFDNHFNPLWEHGHIKFFTKKSLKELCERNNFKVKKIFYSGRVYPISKSIIFIIKKK